MTAQEWDIEGWLESVDCGWRVADKEEPCHHCRKPCRGRAEGGTPSCFTCYHNVGSCKSAAMCGQPLGTTVESRAAEIRANRPKTAPQPNERTP